MAAFIGVDWGSTHARAFRFDDMGRVVDVRRSARGAGSLAQRDYESELTKLLGDWLEPSTEIVICGMAGGRDGWIEAPYLSCPCDLSTLSGSLVRAPGRRNVRIIPGLSTRDSNGVHDVLRGEETQMFGAQLDHDAWIVMPGTHSKWAELRDGFVQRFHTFMTGEAFHLFATQSALRATLDVNAAFDPLAFDHGASLGLEGGALTRLAFAVRAQSLFGALSPQAAKSSLSGLLIGAEIADGLRFDGQKQLVVIGAEEIANLYTRALTRAGANDVVVIDGETAAARGLWRVAHGGRIV